MKLVAIGAHLRRDDIEPLATAVPAGDLFVSALEVHDDQPLGDRELLVRVAGVRAAMLERATFIAIRYGFAFSYQSEAVSKVGTFLQSWRGLLEEHRDHVEMTLKVAATGAQARPDRHAFTSGAEYLRALHAARAAATVDAPFRQQVDHHLVPLAIEHRWSHRDETSLELALLVPRAAVSEVREAAGTLRETGVPFLLSGPWPLEVFAG